MTKTNIFLKLMETILESTDDIGRWDALSTYFHESNEYSKRQLVEMMCIDIERLRVCDAVELRCLLASLVEYTFELCNLPAPSWVNDSDFVYTGSKLDWSYIKEFEKLLELSGAGDIEAKLIKEIERREKAQKPLFKKHNIPNHGFYNAV